MQKTFTRLRHILQADAIEELLEGYQWDLERKPVFTRDDLYKYSACVASSVGEMCTRILLYHDYRQSEDWIIARAREMGLVLQLTNIARDIVTDSEELGRCYLPKEWLTDKESQLIAIGKAREIGESRLLKVSKDLIQDANRIIKTANKGIAALPFHCQGGVRAACNVYAAIGHEIQKEMINYPTRAHIKSSGRAKIALLSVYDLYKLPQQLPKSRQGKIRSFMV